VDGLTSHENHQSSPVGLGWDMQVPFIEQRLKPCTNSGLVGNMCWAGGVSTLSMGGKASRLVYLFSTSDGSRDTFRESADSGYRVERAFAGSGNPNGDAGGVYWKVTTTDGTKYYFGRQNAEWSTSPNNSTLTEPMYAQSSSDACWSNSGHKCDLAYRWNLAYVIDPVGNLQTYQWSKDRYAYGVSGSASAQQYDGAAYLTSVSYGWTTGNATTTPAPQRVDLTYRWRCDYVGCRAPVPHDGSAANYPEIPLDVRCSSIASSCSQGPTSPAFFFLKKLETVTSTYYNGSGYTPSTRSRWT
jgi:hypothetical protein